jgi:hypothetical protein
MKPLRLFVPAALFGAAVACGNVPDDPGARIFPAAGVITGTVLYQGPHPCSSNGHIVGNAILLVFDRRNPPPPNGLAVLPANFADVTGDVLFANEPRYTGTDVYCPVDHGFTDTITVASSFAVSPLGTTRPDGSIEGASYLIEGFFDYTGDFLPTFKIRELPERGDIGGGDIDTSDALKPINTSNLNYQAHFLPIDVGNPQPLQAGQTIPTFLIPSSGYVTSDVVVSLGQSLPLTRPYAYAQGLSMALSSDNLTLTPTVAQSSDKPMTDPSTIPGTAESDPFLLPNYAPILTIHQDVGALGAPPTDLADLVSSGQADANLFELVLPHINLVFGVAPPELKTATATGPTDPFRFQLGTDATAGQGMFTVFQNQYFDPAAQLWRPLFIPEGVVPMLWPEVILSKLVDSGPEHTSDPASLTAQGSPGNPVVIMQGITFLAAPQVNPTGGGNAQGDTLFNTVAAQGIAQTTSFVPDSTDTLLNPDGTPHVFQQDHLTVGLRPVVICFNHLFDNPAAIDPRGTIVTPQSGAAQANVAVNPPPRASVVPLDLLNNGSVVQNDSTGNPNAKGLTGQQLRYQATGLVNSIQYGCLPKGRYAINVVYPDGQAWTVPNEAGACSGTEGQTDYGGLTCTIKPRPVLYSQGNRAVVEIVGPSNPQNCTGPESTPVTTPNADQVPAGTAAPPTPSICLPVAPNQ